MALSEPMSCSKLRLQTPVPSAIRTVLTDSDRASGTGGEGMLLSH